MVTIKTVYLCFVNKVQMITVFGTHFSDIGGPVLRSHLGGKLVGRRNLRVLLTILYFLLLVVL